MSQNEPVVMLPHYLRSVDDSVVAVSPQYSGGVDSLGVSDLKCHICGKIFTRSEHLRRHKRAHLAERPFSCGECHKRFARQDSLRRHQASHDLKRKASASDDMQRYSRACFACASARVRCFRGSTCQRCRIRDLRCEYPSSRSRSSRTPSPTSGDDGRGDERMNERGDDDSCMITWSGENESNSDAFRSMPKESSWGSHLIGAAPNSTSLRQSRNASGSEATLDATSVVQTPLSGGSRLSIRDRLLPQNFISPDATIIAGAQLISQVSEGNIGSLYNYSRINWLPPGDLAHVQQTFGVPLIESTESSNVNEQGVLTNATHMQNIESSPRLPTAGHFEDSYQESFVNSNHVGLALGRSEPFSPEQDPSITTAETRSVVPMNYVDSDGARFSIPARHRQQNRPSIPFLVGQGNTSLSPTVENIDTQLADEYTNGVVWVAEESYVALTDYLKYTSRRNISMPHTDSFPTLKELNEFAGLYFDRFHNSFPLLHKSSVLNDRDGCLLELAIAAIGACYAGTIYARKCSETLHQLVHTLLELATASDYNPSEFPGVFGLRRPGYPQRPTRLQARILNVLGMFHSGNPKLVNLAWESRAFLVTTCIESRMLMSNHYDGWQASRGTEEGEDRFLQQWLEGELKCRAGYFIWMLDCMMAYESDFRTHMDLSDGKAPLPCPEQIWDELLLNKSLIFILNGGPPSLCLALDVLYTEKRLVPNLGELSRILLIHGMYRRVWEVARYQSDILSDWLPMALSEHNHGITSVKSTTLSTSSVVSRWTNGSCDCLDILHWSAKSSILQASGFEHPTILHLHLARLILLAPVSDLQELAKAELRQKTQSHSESRLYSNIQGQSLQNSLHRWVARDYYKARLAIIHAGSVFWYMRRYSCGAVIEPFASYLATLVIWAYSMSTSSVNLPTSPPLRGTACESQGVDGIRTSRSSEASRHHQDVIMQSQQPASEDRRFSNYYETLQYMPIADALEELENHGASQIQLDRPCDDEIVQLFVRFGEQVTPYMARIGDIRCSDAPGKILREGRRLLSDGNHATGMRRNRSEISPNFTWGAAENFVALLSALGAMS